MEFDLEGIGMEFDHAFGLVDLKWYLFRELESPSLSGHGVMG